MRSPSTICGLALRALPPSAWKNTNFTLADVRRLRRALQNDNRKVHPFNPALRWLVRRLIEETANYPANPHRAEAGIALRALICAVLVEALRQMLVPPTEPKEFVAAAIAYLRQHFQEPVRMSDLVRHVGFGRARMFDLFKAQTGRTPNDYLQRLRIEQAQEQLTQTDRSVTEMPWPPDSAAASISARFLGVTPESRRRTSGKALAQGHSPRAGFPHTRTSAGTLPRP